MIRRDLHEQNRTAWNEATRAHNSHKADQAGFLRNGGTTLFPEEVELLGDIRGRAVVHLQCNAGQDSLSLVHLGAEVTGVDISDEAISFARQLSADSGLPATFERSDLYDWFEQAAAAGRRFDVAFSSYGAISWLSDLEAWGRGVASILGPGGRFVLVEFHPFAWMLDEEGSGRVMYPYSTSGTPMTWDEGISDYVARSGSALAPSGYQEGVTGFKNPHPGHDWPWGLAEVVTALLDAGLSLRSFREYPFANGCTIFPGMQETEGARWVMPEGAPSIPLMYSLVAEKG
jgi:SAM-dependent methyltransferase